MMSVQKKKPSADLLSLMSAAATNLTGFSSLWGSILNKGHSEGFSDKELEKLFAPMVKDKMTEAQFRYLMHVEEEKERSKQNREKQKEELNSLRTYAKSSVQKEPEKSDIPPKAPNNSTPTEPQEVQKVRQMVPDLEPPEEDPKDTEIAFLKSKIEELEDALRKATEFKPASDLPMDKLIDVDMNSVQWRMGLSRTEVCMDSIQREIPRLRQRGWKTVEVTMRVI